MMPCTGNHYSALMFDTFMPLTGPVLLLGISLLLLVDGHGVHGRRLKVYDCKLFGHVFSIDMLLAPNVQTWDMNRSRGDQVIWHFCKTRGRNTSTMTLRMKFRQSFLKTATQIDSLCLVALTCWHWNPLDLHLHGITFGSWSEGTAAGTLWSPHFSVQHQGSLK